MNKTDLPSEMSDDATPWGYQLLIDCFGCSEEICCDLDKGYEFLDKICLFLGMTKQSQPYIFKTCDATFPGRPGYSGWLPIIESGIQVHTSAKNRFVSVDVYSCQRFSDEGVEAFVNEWFKPQAIDSQFFCRGRGFLSRSLPSGRRSAVEEVA